MEEKVDLKVIGAGLSRTGTLSLRCALEQLVGPCYHGAIPVIEMEEHQHFWNTCMKNGRLDSSTYHHVLAGYKAGVDMPFILWWKDMIRLHPSAKVIVTVRDPLKWRQSCLLLSKYIKKASTWPHSWFNDLLGKMPTINFMDNIEKTMKVDDLNMTFEEALVSDEAATKFFQKHLEEVKSFVPEENLLVFEVKEGWRPLCDFLNVEEPDIPFPRLNDSKKVIFVTNVINCLAWITVVILPMILVLTSLLLIQDAFQFLLLAMVLVCVCLFIRSFLFNMLDNHTKSSKKTN